MFWCGYLAWMLRFWAVVGAISLALGVIAFLLTIRERDAKIPVVVACGAFLTINCGLCGYWAWCETNFECAKGFGDTYWMPIKYPYGITAIDSLDEGCLDTWGEDDSTIACGITHYTVRFSIMVGKTEGTLTSTGCPVSEKWFSFNLDTGELTCYPSSRVFIDACKGFGFTGMPKLKSLREYYEER
jgi:hypothetical protein